MSKGDETILIFLPKDDNSGIVLRNKGYTESFISSSNYFVDEQNNLHIKTIYKSTVNNMLGNKGFLPKLISETEFQFERIINLLN